MNSHSFNLAGVALEARPSGALWLPGEATLCVSDLHLGKSDRTARRLGLMLPPYEVRATLERLEAEIEATGARRVICLGDSFDDLGAADSLDEGETLWLTRLQAGRDWIWIEGNHDPGPVDLGGSHRDEVVIRGLTFRHIAEPGARGEISGHYHPKCAIRGAGGARPAFLVSAERVILPAFGTYTGGLHCTDPALQALFPGPAVAILTGPRAVPAPLPRPKARRGSRPVFARTMR